jgi:hypothetical protein
VIIGVLSVYSFLCTLALKIVFVLYKKKHENFFKNATPQTEFMELTELAKRSRTSLPNVYSLPPSNNVETLIEIKE